MGLSFAYRQENGHKFTAALIVSWLTVGSAFVLYTARSQRVEIETTLRHESAVLHRLISQRADQHDAHLTGLSALAQAGDPPQADLFLEVAAAVRRFYPRVYAVDLVPLEEDAEALTTRRRDAQADAHFLAIRDAARHSSGKLALIPSPLAPHRYLIVKRSPNTAQARFGLALDIDASALSATDVPFWQTPGVSSSLALPDGTVLTGRPSEPEAPGAKFVTALTVRKPLGSRTQPLLLTTQRTIRLQELLPATHLAFGLAALAAVLLVALLLIRLAFGLRRAERRARLSEQDARLAHASRVNALGEMAAGMAHELTQPLTAILSQSQAGVRLAAGETADRAALGAILAENVAQSKRAAAIVARLRQWTTRTDTEVNPQKLNGCIDNVVFLLGPDARRSAVDLAVRTDPADPAVLGDAVEIEQVIFNLVRNAMDALAHAGRRDGRITISSAVSGSDAVIDISDNGPGIAPAVRERLFEPFITDKPGGMGLGLVLCERLVERMGGQIAVGDNAQAGAVARVTLPLAGGGRG